MIQTIENKNEILAGVDLEPDFVQISWIGQGMKEPETVGMQVGVDKYKIPFLLFLSADGSRIQFGEAAQQEAEVDKTGFLITDLWAGSLQDKDLVLQEQRFSYVKLLGIFFQKLLKLVQTIANAQRIAGLTFTMIHMEEETIHVLQKMAGSLPVERQNIYFTDYRESFLAYLMHQPVEIWNRDVVMFYYACGELTVFHMMAERRFLPVSIHLESEQMEELSYYNETSLFSQQEKQRMDQDFLVLLQHLFGRKLISAVFLTGDGFDQGWMKESLAFLCHGRRVFQGKNLFTKGAVCHLMEEKKWIKRNYAFENGRKIGKLIRLAVQHNGKPDWLEVSKGTEEWYRPHLEAVCLLDDCEEVQVEICDPAIQANHTIHSLSLTPFPTRPNLATKVKIEMEMIHPDTLRLTVLDLGLGELYEATNQIWKKEIMLS